jgi:heme/copper-type cytochrome/quinol oxidase subunit 3
MHAGKQPSRFQRVLDRRWLLVAVAVAIGLVSAVLFFGTLRGAYWDYYKFPKEDAVDPGFYIYPQLRYTIFNSGVLLWSLVGLAACALALRSAYLKRSISGWPYRTILIYFALFIVLLAGGVTMLIARSHGL